jgi:hypothetical protein
MALQYLLERITLTRTDKTRYQSFREKHEHYISDALDKLNDTQRHRLLQHVRSSVRQQGSKLRRQLLSVETAAQQQQQQEVGLQVQEKQLSSVETAAQQQQQQQEVGLLGLQAGAQQQRQQQRQRETVLQLREEPQPVDMQQQQRGQRKEQ